MAVSKINLCQNEKTFWLVIVVDHGSNYVILDTDYDNYSVVYDCKEGDELKQVFGVLSRTRTIKSPEIKKKVEALIDAHFDRKLSKYVSDDDNKCDK